MGRRGIPFGGSDVLYNIPMGPIMEGVGWQLLTLFGARDLQHLHDKAVCA